MDALRTRLEQMVERGRQDVLPRVLLAEVLAPDAVDVADTLSAGVDGLATWCHTSLRRRSHVGDRQDLTCGPQMPEVVRLPA